MYSVLRTLLTVYNVLKTPMIREKILRTPLALQEYTTDQRLGLACREGGPARSLGGRPILEQLVTTPGAPQRPPSLKHTAYSKPLTARQT